MSEEFNTGTGCVVPGSDGRCVSPEDCVGACEYDVGLPSPGRATGRRFVVSERKGDEIVRNAEDQATEWWCALCPTSHPTRAALDKHQAELHAGTHMSTSALLRQTQQDLAASQADLTRVEAALDTARVQIAQMNDRDAIRRAELASATAELETWRKTGQNVIAQVGWVVARSNDGLRCTRCAQTIRRGEAIAPTPAAKGYFEHVECRDDYEETPHA